MDFTTGLFSHLHHISRSIAIDDVFDDVFDDAPDDVLDASLRALTGDLQGAVPSYLGMQLMIVENGHPVTLTAITTEHPAITSLRLPLATLHPGFDPGSGFILYAATPGAFVDLAADLSYALRLPTATQPSTEGFTEGLADTAGSPDGDAQSDAQSHGRLAGHRGGFQLADRHENPLDGHRAGRQDRHLDGQESGHPDGAIDGARYGDQRIVLDADVPPRTLTSGVSGLSELSSINRAIGILIGQGHHPDHADETLRRNAAREGLDPHRYAARLLQR